MANHLNHLGISVAIAFGVYTLHTHNSLWHSIILLRILMFYCVPISSFSVHLFSPFIAILLEVNFIYIVRLFAAHFESASLPIRCRWPPIPFWLCSVAFDSNGDPLRQYIMPFEITHWCEVMKIITKCSLIHILLMVAMPTKYCQKRCTHKPK